MITTVIIIFVFPVAVDTVGINNSFLFFAVMMFFGAIYSWFDLLETKGLDKEQILVGMKAIEKSQIRPEGAENDSLQEEESEKEEANENNKNEDFNGKLDLTTTNKHDGDVVPNEGLDVTTHKPEADSFINEDQVDNKEQARLNS